MRRPEALSRSEPLTWSTGLGTEVWELFRACIEGDLAGVRRLLAKDPSLVRCHYNYRTPLYFAVRENRLEVVEHLLEQGADPLSLAVNDTLLEIARDRDYPDLEVLLQSWIQRRLNASDLGETTAAAIRASDDLAEVRRLLDASPELLHAGDRRSNQPIHWAVMTRNLELVDELLARGADINARRFDGARPIHLTNGDYHYRGWRDVPRDVTTTPEQVLAHLRSRGAFVDICTASHLGDVQRVTELLEENPALANGVSEYVTYYLGSGSPLRNAAARGHLEVVRILLAHGADPNLPEEGIAPRGHALYAAVSNGHHEVARVLLEHGAFPNPPVESSADALSIALSKTKGEMVELLCSCGAARTVDLLGHYGDIVTAAAVFEANPSRADDPDALSGAAGNGHEGFVRLMLRYSPDLPRRVGLAGRTPAITELLFQHGMDPNYRDWLEATPLHEFARRGDIENAGVFLDHGADLNARDEDICSTPLGCAAKFGKQAMVEFLLQRGAKTNLPDDPPWATPMAWATRRGHVQIVEILKAHNAT